MLISKYNSPKPLLKKIVILPDSLIFIILSIFPFGFNGNNKRAVNGHPVKKTNIIAHIKVSQNKFLIQKI